jgi:uncharacterized protein
MQEGRRLLLAALFIVASARARVTCFVDHTGLTCARYLHAPTPGMQTLPVRLSPGDDLRGAVESVLSQYASHAAFVIQGIGSLSVAQLRFAGADSPTELRGDLEILTLAGSVSRDGAHLHMSVSNAQGQVFGGHVTRGCTVRTTAELLLALLPDHSFTRELDPATGYAELRIHNESR